MVNSTNIKKVIKALGHAGDSYNQRKFRHECGSPSCIFGWASYLSCQEKNLDFGNILQDDLHDIATSFMGLDDIQTRALYTGVPYKETHDRYPHLNSPKPTNEQAMGVLQYLIETGKVNWWRFNDVQ